MSEWSKWIDIEENTGHRGCGVYRIRLVDSQGTPVTVSRFLHDDEDGILQIGHSRNIHKRIRYFRGAMKEKNLPHAEGRRLSLIKRYAKFNEKLMNSEIQYSFQRLPGESEAKKEEERLLKYYFRRYGEVPVLNNNLPDKYIDWGTLNCE